MREDETRRQLLAEDTAERVQFASALAFKDRQEFGLVGLDGAPDQA
jgi:hypothetical protein